MGFPGIMSPYFLETPPPITPFIRPRPRGPHPPPGCHLPFQGSESPRPRKAMDPEGFHQTGFPMRRFFGLAMDTAPRKLHDGSDGGRNPVSQLTSWYGKYPQYLYRVFFIDPNKIMEVDGSDPEFLSKRVICRFQPWIFQGVFSN